MMAFLSILMVAFMVRSLFKISIGCITMVSLVHAMRKTHECSTAEWDDLLED